MAHFAEIIEGKVTRVLVTNNSWTLEETLAWLNDNISQETWLQCSYNGNIRHKFPGIGDLYRADLDAFISPQPYDDWVLNLDTLQYESTVDSKVQLKDLQLGV